MDQMSEGHGPHWGGGVCRQTSSTSMEIPSETLMDAVAFPGYSHVPLFMIVGLPTMNDSSG